MWPLEDNKKGRSSYGTGTNRLTDQEHGLLAIINQQDLRCSMDQWLPCFSFLPFLNRSFTNILYFVYPPLLIKSIKADNFSLKIVCQSVKIHTLDGEYPTLLGFWILMQWTWTHYSNWWNFRIVSLREEVSIFLIWQGQILLVAPIC